jgi:hypothetical protein
MAAPYSVRGHSFAADPRVWSAKLAGFSTTRSYDPSADGKRVVALFPVETPRDRNDHLVFLMNFFDEVRRRVAGTAR